MSERQVSTEAMGSADTEQPETRADSLGQQRTRGWKIATFTIWFTLGLVIAATIAGR